jgi:hypothetical protein
MSSRRCCPRRPRRRCSGALSAPRVLLGFLNASIARDPRSRLQLRSVSAARLRPPRSSMDCPCCRSVHLAPACRAWICRGHVFGSLRTPLANSGGSYPPIHAGCTWFFSGGLSAASPASCVQRGVQADGGGGRGPATGWWLASRGTDGEEDARFFVPPPFGSHA